MTKRRKIHNATWRKERQKKGKEKIKPRFETLFLQINDKEINPAPQAKFENNLEGIFCSSSYRFYYSLRSSIKGSLGSLQPDAHSSPRQRRIPLPITYYSLMLFLPWNYCITATNYLRTVQILNVRVFNNEQIRNVNHTEL